MNTVETEPNDKTQLGFWIYLMTDCVVFASLFAAYAVLHDSTGGSESARELFNIQYVLIETLLLLTSSFTSGLALLAAHTQNVKNTLRWLMATFILGSLFLGMELFEFQKMINEGNSWTLNASLSSYFALLGTHGLHIAVGLLWLAVLSVRIYKKRLITSNVQKLTLFSLFWHFLDIVWIFIFSMVYLLGVS